MIRKVIPLALFGLTLIPDGAQACGRRYCCYPPPIPMVYYPPVILLQPCVPIPKYYPAPTKLPPPKVRQEPTPTVPKVTVQPESTAPAKPNPAVPEPTPSSPVPPPRPVAPGIPPGASTEPKTPLVVPGSSLPPAGLATPQSAVPIIPAGETPKPMLPILPIPEPTPKVPEPPKPSSESGKIPPLAPPLPADPSLPPLTIPQGNSDPKKGPGTSTSQSSPVSGTGSRVDIFPVDGTPPSSPSAKRKVGFFNHTDRDVTLTVEGESIRLPSKHFISATVPKKFRWHLDAGLEKETEIPTASLGVEVVIRK